MQTTRLILLFTTLAALASLALLPTGTVAPPNLIEIQEQRLFDEWTTSKDRVALVYFYAHWSPTCKAFTREYKEVAKYFGRSGYENEIMITKIDGPNHHALSRKLGIDGFPHVMLYSHEEPGKSEKYDGEYSKDDLIAWVTKRLHPKMKEGGKKIPAKPKKRRLA